MRYKQLGSTDIKVSIVGMGCWPIGGRKWGKVDDEGSIEAIKKAVELGINFFDTADVYGFGHSEEMLGKVLKYQSEVIIATKVGLRWNSKGKFRHDLSPKYIKEACEASLKRLNRETIDLYQIHWPDPDTPFEKTLNTLDSLVKEGKVKYIGACNLGLDLLEQISRYPWFVSYQDVYNLFNEKVKDEHLPYCKQNNISFIAYEPLFKGMLTGKFNEKPSFEKGDHRKYEERFTNNFSYYKEKTDFLMEISKRYDLSLAQMSLALLLKNEGVTSVIPGAKNAHQVEQNASACDINEGLLEIIQAEVDVTHFFEKVSRAGLKLGVNWRRQLTELTTEIAVREGLSCSQVLEAPEILEIIDHPKFSGPQKIAMIKDSLTARRYPNYTKAKTTFYQKLKDMKLHPKIRIIPPAYFENKNIQIGFFKYKEEEQAKIKASLKKLEGVDLVEDAIKSAENIS